MKLGRNDPCHCGSGKKYKKCHQVEDDAKRSAEFAAQAAQRAEAAAAAAAAAETEEGAEDAPAKPTQSAPKGPQIAGGGKLKSRQPSASAPKTLPRRSAV